jgi:hypothetical protein
LVAAALLLFFIGAGLTEATGVTAVRGTVIRLISPEGTLVVEVEDPDVSVSISGTELIITGAGVKEIRLKTGQYQMRTSKDGKVLRQELITVIKNERVVVRVSKEAEPLAEADRWEESVATLSPVKQVRAVAMRLKELNLGFDGKVTPTIENGVVTGLRFFADDVDDISPVRALPGLKTLACDGSKSRTGILESVAPLAGLPLTHLSFAHTQVSDLAPLKGMPLVHINCSNTSVKDLSPLEAMKLRFLLAEVLPVTDIGPLRGIPIRELGLCETRGVKDISVLRGMPLEYLNLTGIPVTDLSVLAETSSLRWLILDDMPVSDLTPLRGLSLRILAINQTKVTDLTPLGKIALEQIDYRATPLADVSPLRGIPLKRVNMDYRPERDAVLRSITGLEQINGIPVAQFWRDEGSPPP